MRIRNLPSDTKQCSVTTQYYGHVAATSQLRAREASIRITESLSRAFL